LIVFLGMDFMLAWLPALEPLLREAGAAGSWSFAFTLLFGVFLGWYFRRCGKERKNSVTVK
jgi:hypothetical protein